MPRMETSYAIPGPKVKKLGFLGIFTIVLYKNNEAEISIFLLKKN